MSTTQNDSTSNATKEIAMVLAHIATIRPDLKSYLTGLSQNEIISILRIIGYYQHDKDIENAIKEMKTCPTSYLVMVLCFQLTQFNNHTDRELINRCKAILESLKQDPTNLANAISLLDDEDDENDFMTDDDYIVKVNDNTLYLSRADDLGIQLLNYNICPEDDITIPSISDEERKQHSIIKVIEDKIKFKYVLKSIQKYIDEKLFNNNNEMSVLGEIAKKFNLNFRIHVYNSEKHCEELLRNDNDGWLIKWKATQTKFEIAKVDKHFFKYEFLSIPKEYLNNVIKLYAYFELIGDSIKQSDNPTEEINCSSLEFIRALKNLKLIENNKALGKLIYKNGEISNVIGISRELLNKVKTTVQFNQSLQKYARKNGSLRSQDRM